MMTSSAGSYRLRPLPRDAKIKLRIQPSPMTPKNQTATIMDRIINASTILDPLDGRIHREARKKLETVALDMIRWGDTKLHNILSRFPCNGFLFRFKPFKTSAYIHLNFMQPQKLLSALVGYSKDSSTSGKPFEIHVAFSTTFLLALADYQSTLNPPELKPLSAEGEPCSRRYDELEMMPKDCSHVRIVKVKIRFGKKSTSGHQEANSSYVLLAAMPSRTGTVSNGSVSPVEQYTVRQNDSATKRGRKRSLAAISRSPQTELNGYQSSCISNSLDTRLTFLTKQNKIGRLSILSPTQKTYDSTTSRTTQQLPERKRVRPMPPSTLVFLPTRSVQTHATNENVSWQELISRMPG